VIVAPGLGTRALTRAAWLACLFGTASCGACSEGEVAELRAVVGPVQRDFVASQGTWRSAPAGSVFGVGDGLRTGQGARAELALLPDGRLRVEADTVVRFSDVAPAREGGARQGSFDVETGSIELESGASELLIDAPAGIARVSKNSRVRVRRSGKDGVGLEVAVGRAEVERGNEVIRAESGQTLALAVGRIEVELEPVAPLPAEVAPAPIIEEPVEPGAAEIGLEASLDSFELEIPAGETATVHDPRPPITVGFATQGCGKGVELDVRELRGHTRRVRAPTTPALRLGAGSFRYSVRCIGDAAGSTRGNGMLRVVRDSGGRRLPRTAPKVSLDADGRRYNLRYQNLLPELRLRWPQAPEAASYTLELTAEGGATIREQGTKPEIRLRSGRVREGEYRFFLSAGAARSPETTLRVTFDDTARTAQLSEPKDLVFSPSSSVRVAGAALAGSMVRVGNVALTVGGDGRFAEALFAPPAGRALAVRVQHPIAGVHYYVRRPAR
jgi:hypothetical protein